MASIAPSKASRRKPTAKPIAKPALKPPAKAAAGPVSKASAAKPAAAAPSGGSQPPKAGKADKAQKSPKRAKAHALPKPPKLVRDSFTMPRADFDLIELLKVRAIQAKRPAKKSELLRAGLQALAALEPAALVAALERLVPLKPGRPKKPA